MRQGPLLQFYHWDYLVVSGLSNAFPTYSESFAKSLFPHIYFQRAVYGFGHPLYDARLEFRQKIPSDFQDQSFLFIVFCSCYHFPLAAKIITESQPILLRIQAFVTVDRNPSAVPTASFFFAISFSLTARTFDFKFSKIVISRFRLRWRQSTKFFEECKPIIKSF